MTRRLSVCLAAPGHTLLSTAGSTRNILATATALSKWVNVTVAFRDIAKSVSSANFQIKAIEPVLNDGVARDDVATRGLNPLSHLSYLRSLRHYARRSASSYDLVFEKGWRLSGYLSRAFEAHGVRAIVIENDARIWNEPIRDVRSIAKFLTHYAAQRVAGFCSRRLSLIIAETHELKSALVAQRRITPERIEVVQLGLDHSLFRPIDQASARESLGLSNEPLMMVYVGGMDQYHDLSPLLEALRKKTYPDLELHLVGDGEYRRRYESSAQGLPVPVVFHGQVEHLRVPDYIAVADVCLAPYQTRGFFRNEVAFSTLKIPEYMACARPVISVPSGHILNLVEDGVTGFLFHNETAQWIRFLSQVPPRQRLAEMGRRAAPTVASLSWSATAGKYLELGGKMANKSPCDESDHRIEWL